jgi:hypothetical protein
LSRFNKVLLVCWGLGCRMFVFFSNVEVKVSGFRAWEPHD